MQRFVPIEDLFKGRHFDRQIIVWCVSWYTSFKLSLRDLVIMMADRGISVTPYGQKKETIRGQSKIDDRHEEQEVGATAGVRDGLCQPGASAAE
jgi:transposase-like protein